MSLLILSGCLFILNFIIYLSLNRLILLFNIYDRPDGKLKKHKKKIPLLGGTIFFINFIFIFILELFFLNIFENFNKRELFSLLFIVSSFFFLGLYDDKFKMSVYLRIVLAIVICLITITLNKNLVIQSFQISFYKNQIILDNLKLIFTIFSFVAFIHACNMLDGINLQLPLFYIFLTLYLFLVTSAHTHIYLLIIISLLFILILNYRNKIFFGDSGVYSIASVLSYFIVIEHNFYQNIKYADEIFLMMILPGFELIRLSVSRLLKGKNIFDGDLNHIHHVLVKKKNSLLFTNLMTSSFPIISLIAIFFFQNMYILFFFILLTYYLILIFLKR